MLINRSVGLLTGHMIFDMVENKIKKDSSLSNAVMRAGPRLQIRPFYADQACNGMMVSYQDTSFVVFVDEVVDPHTILYVMLKNWDGMIDRGELFQKSRKVTDHTQVVERAFAAVKGFMENDMRIAA